jgi:predicted transcriptional regulator
MKVLLSIKPEFVEKIFAGEKRYEFRKSAFKNREVKTVVVYATQPIGKLVGEFDVREIVVGTPSEIWERTQDAAGISQEFFDAYFHGRRCAFALAIENVQEYAEPKPPSDLYENFVAPQSYMYVGNDGGRTKVVDTQLPLL